MPACPPKTGKENADLEIQISVNGKVAAATDKRALVCGNSDNTVRFLFDAEWAALPQKTARFCVFRGDARNVTDVPVIGDTAAFPALYGADGVAVGVYAEGAATSTPAEIVCLPCIKDLCSRAQTRSDDPANRLLERLSQPLTRITVLLLRDCSRRLLRDANGKLLSLRR